MYIQSVIRHLWECLFSLWLDYECIPGYIYNKRWMFNIGSVIYVNGDIVGMYSWELLIVLNVYTIKSYLKTHAKYIIFIRIGLKLRFNCSKYNIEISKWHAEIFFFPSPAWYIWSIDTPTWWCVRVSDTSGITTHIEYQYDTCPTRGFTCSI